MLFRSNADEKALSRMKVPIAYGPIQKFLARIEQQSNFENVAGITLPRLSFEITSYRYDPTRKVSPITKFCGVDNNKMKKMFMPVPYDIGFRLSMVSKLQDDVLQVLEQILPFFQPSYTVTVNLIEEINEKRDIPFTLTNISFRDEYENNFDKRRYIQYDFDFVAKAYFYSELPTDESGGIIKRVQVDYTTNINAPREVRYAATPAALHDYNSDQTAALTATLEPTKTLMKVTSSLNLQERTYIQVNKEVMRIEEIDGTNVIVSRGKNGTSVGEHYSGDKINLITIADDELIPAGDDFGFNETTTFFQDFLSYSPNQGSDV